MRRKPITIKLRRPRNPFAVAARQRKAGRHPDRRKRASRRACRGPHKEER